MSLNLATIVRESARIHADNIGIIQDDRRLTFSELFQSARKFARVLRNLGLEPGDKVSMLIPNILEFPIVFHGIVYAGCVVVPLNILLRGGEVAYHIQDSDSKAVVVASDLLPAAQPAFDETPACEHLIVIGETGGSGISFYDAMDEATDDADIEPTMPDDPAVIIYTSGTTGQPKGAVLSHSNLVMNCNFLHTAVVPVGPGDVALATLPLYHSFGLTFMMNAFLYVGAAVSIVPRFDPELILQIMKRDKVTAFAGVPTMYIALLGCPEEDLRVMENLRVCVSGGAALPVEVLNTYRDKLGVIIHEGYGLSETSPLACIHHPGRTIKPGSIGQPIWGVELAAMNEAGDILPPYEDGEIVIRGHNVMLGYYGRPEATEQAITNGWLHTGDVGHRDEDNYFYIVDRLKDMIIRGGYNVYPREVEEVIYTMDGVVETSVVGIPDPVKGEEVCACVALAPGVELTADDVISFCKERVAAYKYPRKVVFFDELPKGSTGKTLKRELRGIVSE